MKILLYDLTQPALLVSSKTGITYVNQAGGTACNQPELEGYLIPLDHDYDLVIGKNSMAYAICSLFPPGSAGYISKEIAKRIETLINKYSAEGKEISVDWDKFEDSYESWLHVKVNGNLFGLLERKREFEAVLTWPNSD